MKFNLKRKKYAEAYCGKYEYGRTLERVEYLLKEIEIDQNKIDAIEYIMKVIRLDLQSELLTRMIYPKQYKKNNWKMISFVLIYLYRQIIRSEIQMAKKKIDKQKLITKIIALILAGLMVLSMAFTLIWYLIAK